jgi:hypothetical protein
MAPGRCLALNQSLVATPDAIGSPPICISSPNAATPPEPGENQVEREPCNIGIPGDSHIDGDDADDADDDDDDDEDDAAVELMRDAFVQMISVSD